MEVSRLYGFYTPCIGCHAYFHILRAFIALDIEALGIISGERVKHSGRFKINQSKDAVDTYRKILKEFGIKFYTPILNIDTEEELNKYLTFKWEEGKEQFKCLFTGSSTLKNMKYPKKLRQAISNYLNEFVKPLAVEVISNYKEGNFKYKKAAKEIIDTLK